MAGRTAVLAIRVITDAASARRDLDRTGDSVQGVAQRAGKFKLPALAVAGGLTAIATAAVKSASALQQSTGAVQSVFGKYAADIIKQAKGAATQVGLSTSSYENLATVLGSQLKNLGTPMDQVSGKTADLVKKGADLAATFGGTTADAVSAISGLLRGERDPIERYGVSINDASIKAYEAAHGLGKLSGAAKKTADTQAALALLTQQTAAAQGQFSRETKTAAGSQEIANAKFENAKAALGQRLLPAVAAVTGMFTSLFGFIASHVGLMQTLAVTAGVLAAAILLVSTYTKIAAIVTPILASEQGILNAVFAANPVMIVVLAIAALIAGVILAYQHFATFRAIVETVFAVIKTVVIAALTIIKVQILAWLAVARVAFAAVSAVVRGVAGAFTAAKDTAVRVIGNIISAVTGLPGKIASVVGSMVSAGGRLIGGLFQGIRDGLAHAGGAVADVVGRFVNGIASAINNLLNLPWIIKLHIAGPGPLPDLNFGPYTLLPRIPVSAAAYMQQPPADLADLRPGFTLLASGSTLMDRWSAGLAPASTSSTISGPSIIINFNGLVTDPDGAAREIERLLRGRGIRLGNGSAR